MINKSTLKAATFGIVLAASAVFSGNAQAGLLGYELTINDPIFDSANGDQNVPDFQLTNISDAGTGFQITDFTLTIGDTAFNFDFVRSQSVFVDTLGALSSTLNSPDLINDNSGPDLIDYDFAGFDAGDIFRFEADVDPDSGAVVQDYRQILFPTSMLSVTFSNGATLSEILNPSSATQAGYTFSQVQVSEPATFALLGSFLIGGIALRRKTRR